MITSKKLSKFKSITHGFFDRQKGASRGIYKSLNCGLGSYDNKKKVLKNLKIVCKKIKCSPKNLILLNKLPIFASDQHVNLLSCLILFLSGLLIYKLYLIKKNWDGYTQPMPKVTSTPSEVEGLDDIEIEYNKYYHG